MKMQHEMLEKQKIKEQEESSVKLTKLEINSFGVFPYLSFKIFMATA
jgi:hypothetical protein